MTTELLEMWMEMQLMELGEKLEQKVVPAHICTRLGQPVL